MTELLLGLLILACQLMVLGLTVKLHTEYVKDRAQDHRAARWQECGAAGCVHVAGHDGPHMVPGR